MHGRSGRSTRERRGLGTDASRKLHSSPAWSPDGKWIVYTADESGNRFSSKRERLETGETHALTKDNQVYADPVFSPDGNRLAYVSTKGRATFISSCAPIHGGRLVRSEMPLSRENSFGRGGSTSASGIFTSSPHGSATDANCWSSRIGTLRLVRATVASTDEPDAMARGRKILEEQTLYRTRPDVAPEGKRIVYASTAGAADQYNHLYVLPVEGGHPYKLTFGDHDDFHPRWSPDGESIAYISNERAALNSTFSKSTAEASARSKLVGVIGNSRCRWCASSQ